jgi:hypothetical protein
MVKREANSVRKKGMFVRWGTILRKKFASSLSLQSSLSIK